MIEQVSYGGWKNNLRLSGPTTELIITLEVGPRVLRYAFIDGTNVFFEDPSHLGGTDEKEWMMRGGHRNWTAPEAEHSYDPDNVPVSWKKDGDEAIELVQAPSKAFGFQKTMRVEMLPGEVVRVTHRLTNVSGSAVDLTPWALSAMRGGGVALIPQPLLDIHPTEFPESRVPKPDDFLPNRELVLWPFTNLTDGRFSYSKHFLRVRHSLTLPATKIGMRFPTGWVAYENGGVVFAKHFVGDSTKPYADRNSNFELFTDAAILELESLAPLEPLEPLAVREHVEHWVLRRASNLQDEDAAQAFFEALPPLHIS